MKRKRGNAKPKRKKPSFVGASEAIQQVVGLNANYSSKDLLCEHNATMESETPQDEPSMKVNQAALEEVIANTVNSVLNINTAFMGNLSKFSAKTSTKSSRGDVTCAEYGSRMETETPWAETTMRGHQTDPENGGAADVNGMMGFSPNELREMIKSIIGDLSKEAGGITAKPLSCIANNPVSNAPVFHPQGERTLQEALPNQNPQYKEQELKASLSVIKKIMKSVTAKPFNVPVDPIALRIPDYFDVIDTPMDFGTIRHNLENGYKYMNSEDVYKDVQLIWENCSKYDTRENEVLVLMRQVKKNFMNYWTAAGLHTERDQTTDESTMMGSIHRKGRSVRHVPDEVGASHVQMHQSSLIYKQAYQPNLRSNELNSSLGPADVNASSSKGYSPTRHSMHRRDQPVVPISVKARPSQLQLYNPSAIENRPQMSSNQPQSSRKHTKVTTSDAGFSQRNTRLQERPAGAVADSGIPSQIQFHGGSRMDDHPNLSSNQPALQVKVNTAVMVGRGHSLRGRGKRMLSRGDDRGTGRIAAGTSVPPTTVSQRTAPGLVDDHVTPSTNPTTPLPGAVNLSIQANITGDGNNGIDNEPVTPTGDVLSISTTMTGKVADMKCDCHGKIKLTISEDGKHFIGSTAPARSYRKFMYDDLTDFWPKWSLVDKVVKESWWEEFQGAFCLPDYPIHIVRIAWEKIGAIIYSSALYDAHKHWKKTGRKKGWMKEDVFPKFVDLWTTDDFKKKSEQASRNRSSNVHGVGKHTGGSIPFAEHLARMKRARGEIHPALAYSITHRKKGDNSNKLGPWVNAKSKQIYSKYVSLVAGSQPSTSALSSSSQPEPQAKTLLETPPENIPWSGKHWDKAAGGVKRGGRVYGFGENISILDISGAPNANTAPSKSPMTRDDAVRIMQENPIFGEIIADTLAAKVSEKVAEVGVTVAEKVSETVVEKASETLDGKLINLVRQIGEVIGGTSNTIDMLVEALRRVQAERGTLS